MNEFCLRERLEKQTAILNPCVGELENILVEKTLFFNGLKFSHSLRHTYEHSY
jgi:hypothetical protein